MIDARGIPTRECPACSCDIFNVKVIFDENYEIGMYLLDAECTMCGTLITAPTPLDIIGG